MYRDTTKMREDLKDDNKLLTLLDNYRHGNTLTEYEKEIMWLGVSDFCYHLSKKHYGEPQKTHVKGQTTIEHSTRMDVVIQFVLESSLDIPIKGVIFSIHRRYAWLELVVEMRVLGVSYLEELSVTKKVNSIITKDIIIGIKIERELRDVNKGRIPTEREVIVEYTRQLLNKGKTVSFAGIQRFSQRYSSYKEAKRRTDCLSFDETYYQQPEIDCHF